MLEPSSVFYMPQAQLSMWDCDYILLENERRFQWLQSQWRRQRSKGARSFRGQKILKPGQVTESPGRRDGLA